MSSSHTGDQPDHNSSSHTKVQQGQDGRSQVQYAEFDPSTAPQVCFGSGPEAFRPPIEPDIAHQRPGDAASQAATGEKTEGPKELWARLGKRKGLWLIGLAVVICIILAVGISVPLVGDKISRSSKGGSEASTSAPPSPTSNITSPTDSDIPGCRREKYTSDVDWVGVRDGKDWDFELKAVGGAAECCAYCYETARECNAWLYFLPKDPGPDCTVIIGYNGDDADDQCPNGRPDVMFNIDDDKPANLAGVGPCASFTKWI
ncbi:hypothetical protein VUR80DRAFT_8887 [Thermomyces stellatus]